MNSIRSRRFLKRLESLLEQAVKNKNFRNSPAFAIADYFRSVLHTKGYTCDTKSWEKTKAAASEIILQHSHISIDVWKECIEFSFSEQKNKHKFWGKVPIVNLGTVIKIFNFYKQCKESEVNSKSSKIDYGKLR